MKLSAVTLSAALAAGVALFCVNTIAADQPSDSADKNASSKPAAPDMDEKKWMEAATPGPAHKALEAFVGDWDVASKWWWTPDAPPAESKGVSKVRAILGGRFVQEDHDGQFMGKPYKGLGVTGYDNFKKKYVTFWIDDSGTGMFTTEGAASGDGKEFTLMGKMDDPASGEKDKPVKCIIRLVSSDKRIMEMHDLSRGDRSKEAEMTYTRKLLKPAASK
jgi:hypothetical protein